MLPYYHQHEIYMREYQSIVICQHQITYTHTSINKLTDPDKTYFCLSKKAKYLLLLGHLRLKERLEVKRELQ